MRFIQFTVERPFHPRSGGPIRDLTNALALARLGDVLCVTREGPVATGLPAGLAHAHLTASDDRKLWRYSKDSPTLLELTPEELAEAKALVEKVRPDIVVVECVFMAALLPTLSRLGVPIVLDMHNIESALLADGNNALSLRRRLLGRGYNKSQIAAARAQDVTSGNQASQLWTCSPEDRAGLRALGVTTDIHVVPNPIPDETVLDLPISAERYAALRLCFIGHLSYRPNVEAVGLLAAHAVPGLKASGLPWTLTVAGRTPSKRVIKACASSGMRLVSSPADVEPILAANGFAPMPLHVGGGTRIKALEALAAGLVICATAKAVEGLGLLPGVHYIQVDDPRRIAPSIVDAARNPGRTAAMAEAGRRLVRERFTRTAIAREIASAIADLQPGNGPLPGKNRPGAKD